MKIDPIDESALMINATGIGTVTRKMVLERSVELAIIDGRSAKEASKSDWELTGGSEEDSNQIALESVPESERWDPLPGSSGNIVPVPSSDGEDDDGRSMAERLVNEGVNEAGHDQMLQSARAAEKKDSLES